MSEAIDTARAILSALTQAHSAGRTPQAIVLDAATQDRIRTLGLGYWSAGPATWSLFNVPVVTGVEPEGWRLQLASAPDAPDPPGS